MRFFGLMYAGVVVFVHVFLMWNIRRGFRSGLWHYAALALTLLLMVALLFRRRIVSWPYGDCLTDILNIWLGFVFMMTLALVARTGLGCISLVADRLFASDWHRWFGSVRAVRISFVVGLLAFGYALWEAQAIRITTVRIQTDKLPPGVDTFRIAALTDMHITSRAPVSTVKRIVDLTNSSQPDLVAVIGDFVDSRLEPGGPRASALAGLTAGSGKYAVLGNHELYNGMHQAMRFIESAGFTMLRGSADNSGTVAVVGVDDPQLFERIGIADAVAKADTTKYILLLSHRPDVPAGTIGTFDLELAGHTHGGQVWPGHLLVKRLNRFGQGLTRLAGPDGSESLLFVSNGVRYWGPPVRFLARPEIIVVELSRSN